MTGSRPVGAITRGTTNPNRLRRCDRWLAGPQAWRLRRDGPPVVVDLGYGASGVTARELSDRLLAVRPSVSVVGLEISPERVSSAQALARPGLRFAVGGFEIPLPGTVRIIRAFNVLRQYDESQVRDAWALMQSRLDDDGLIVDGTCDELGRIAAWVAVTRSGPVSLTVSLRLRDLADPAVVAERLPKALIHRNVPGEAVHAYLSALAAAWARSAGYSAYGARQRFVQTALLLRDEGWPLTDNESRWRLGELTVAWPAVAPAGPH